MSWRIRSLLPGTCLVLSYSSTTLPGNPGPGKPALTSDLSPEFVPPYCRIGRAIQHGGQFFLDAEQARLAQFNSRSLDRIVLAAFGIASVHFAQVSYFLAKAGEVFRDVIHCSYHTPSSPPGVPGSRYFKGLCGCIATRRLISSVPDDSLPAPEFSRSLVL